jgi:hypothetical protein
VELLGRGFTVESVGDDEQDGGCGFAAVWEKGYVDAGVWSKWNAEFKRLSLDGALARGAEAKLSLASACDFDLDHAVAVPMP